MMMNLAIGTVDVVFDVTGVKPHDLVPGAHIALKAGAFLGDASGRALSEADLANMLLRPDDDGPPYVLASSEVLYRQAIEKIGLVGRNGATKKTKAPRGGRR
jgi:fructose-1,6-bisphosphatase/inositol monophosphatase family enzyme